MFESILGIDSNSWIDQVFRLGMFLVGASLLAVLAVRLAISAVATTRVKARREWQVAPARGEEQSVNFLHEDVKHLLEHASNPTARVERLQHRESAER